MATISLSHHVLDGALGPILVDVRSASRKAAQPAVLIHHGFKGFKDYGLLQQFAQRVAKAGFTAVTLSVSGAGVDEAGEFTHIDRFSRNTYTRELDDLHVVLRAMIAGELDFAAPSSIGLVGHSRGGGVALLLAHEAPEIVAVVTWAAITRVRRMTETELDDWRRKGSIPIHHARLGIDLPLLWEVAADALHNESGRFNILRAAQELDRPLLVIHGEDDETVPVEEGRALAQRAHAETLFIPEGRHTFGATHPWSAATLHTDQVFEASVRFLARHLV